MGTPIMPRPIRGRLYCQSVDALSPALSKTASAQTAADPHPGGMARPLERETPPPLRRCADCKLDLGRDVLRALCTCPRWGKRRLGIESHCLAFVGKDGAK